MKHVLAKLILQQEKERCQEEMKELELYIATVGKKQKNPAAEEKKRTLIKR